MRGVIKGWHQWQFRASSVLQVCDEAVNNEVCAGDFLSPMISQFCTAHRNRAISMLSEAVIPVGAMTMLEPNSLSLEDIQFVDSHWSVLVAEDNAECRQQLIRALNDYRFPIEVVEVSSAARLIEELSSNRHDVAFVDIALGTSSGLEAVAQARECGMRTFVVVASGSRTTVDRDDARALGAYEFIGKPLQVSDVHRVLDAFQRISSPSSALLIDDSGTARKLMSRIFERSMFRVMVDVAPDGIEGIEKFARAPSDFVFIDLNMAALDGLSTARIFRAFSDKVKIVLVSGDTGALAEISGMRTLQKPFGPRQLDVLLHDLYGLEHPSLAG